MRSPGRSSHKLRNFVRRDIGLIANPCASGTSDLVSTESQSSICVLFLFPTAFVADKLTAHPGEGVRKDQEEKMHRQTIGAPESSKLTERVSTQDRLIRLPEVMDRVGMKRSAIYQRMREGRFPRSRSLGSRCAVWVEAEIEDWILSIRSL